MGTQTGMLLVSRHVFKITGDMMMVDYGIMVMMISIYQLLKKAKNDIF